MRRVSRFRGIRIFQGFCFDGADYVAELPGFYWHQQVTGRTIGPGLDGCYVVGRWTEDGYEVGTDSRGMARLFVWEDGADWAVGSSLHGLAVRLAARGARLTPRRVLFDAMFLPGAFVQQQMSRSSIFEEITLLPSSDRLLITADGLRRITASSREPEIGYGEALTDYVQLWRSRFLTLLEDPRVQISADLSGGLDSRVGFAFLAASGRLASDGARVRVVSNVNAARDLEVARAVAASQGVQVNGPKLAQHRPGYSAALALDRWREHCLGVYTPVYFHKQPFDPFFQNVHGAGGECFRYTYKPADARAWMRAYRPQMDEERLEELTDLVAAEHAAEAARRPHLHPLSVQYREHRNRFHFGYAPHDRAAITPLNSSALDAVTDRPGLDPISVYHDIYDALVPGLKDIPFDSPEKDPATTGPSEAALAARSATAHPGRVFAVEDAAPTYELGGDSVRAWMQDARCALANADLDELLGPDRVARLRTVVDAVEARLPQLPRPNSPEFIGLSAAIAADFALRASRSAAPQFRAEPLGSRTVPGLVRETGGRERRTGRPPARRGAGPGEESVPDRLSGSARSARP